MHLYVYIVNFCFYIFILFHFNLFSYFFLFISFYCTIHIKFMYVFSLSQCFIQKVCHSKCMYLFHMKLQWCFFCDAFILKGLLTGAGRGVWFPDVDWRAETLEFWSNLVPNRIQLFTERTPGGVKLHRDDQTQHTVVSMDTKSLVISSVIYVYALKWIPNECI